ncbi:MAG: Fic family protein [Bryobacteraceae bacterium]
MDPYVYPETKVLRNLRDIRDPERLEKFEMDMTTSRVRELLSSPKPGRFDSAHLQAIHHYIFQDVYDWAGEFRTVDISKGNDLFGLNQHIVSNLNRTFSGLKAERFLQGSDAKRFCGRGAYYLGEINAIHPFRDGNGRTQREFMRQLALRNGYTLDWSKVSRDQMIEASKESFRRGNSGLERVLSSALIELRSRGFDRDDDR